MANIWEAALRDLEEKVRTDTFDFWFKSIDFARHDDQTVFLAVEDEFFKAWIEENYLDLIEDSLSKVAGEGTGVELVVGAEPAAEPNPEPEPVRAVEQTDERVAAKVGRLSEEEKVEATVEPPAEPAPPADPGPTEAAHRERIVESGLNPRYTFDSFVVGSSNQFVHAACAAVANKPAESYNPLFIFGGVGLGKTHLLQAVGNRMLRENPDLQVGKLSSEDFMNQVITSIRQEKMNEFRTEFRNRCDVLLIDDIQTIAGKDATQKEFFHTFNALYNSGKQIVITSDQPPQELPGIEERLASRFAWGLCADIQPPEIETRVAIIEQKAEREGIPLKSEVAHLIAQHIRSNVRELEGTLVRLSAQAKLMDQPITVQMARDMLDRMNIDQQRELDVDRIIRTIAEYFDITASDIKGKRRTRAISKPRQYAMFLARTHTDHSYPELGRKFGGKDHTTVLAACQKLEKLVEEDEEMADLIHTLEKKLSVAGRR
jgi:chromosomal replication initiator protein